MEVNNEWGEGEDPLAHPELERVDRIALGTPVNHTSVSPDGRTMVAVGDTNEVFVFAVSSQGHVTLTDTIEGGSIIRCPTCTFERLTDIVPLFFSRRRCILLHQLVTVR